MPRKANSQPRYPLNMRMHSELRDQLEAAAKASGRSLTQEATYRLAQSFAYDQAFGDPEVRRLAMAASVAFQLGGQHYSDGKPGWTRNRDAYLAGMRGVIDALLTGIPDVTDQEIWLEIECLKSSLLTRVAQRRLREQEQAEPPAKVAAA